MKVYELVEYSYDYHEFTNSMGLFATKEALLKAFPSIREITVLDPMEDWYLNILDLQIAMIARDKEIQHFMIEEREVRE